MRVATLNLSLVQIKEDPYPDWLHKIIVTVIYLINVSKRIKVPLRGTHHRGMMPGILHIF